MLIPGQDGGRKKDWEDVVSRFTINNITKKEEMILTRTKNNAASSSTNNTKAI